MNKKYKDCYREVPLMSYQDRQRMLEFIAREKYEREKRGK